MTSFLSPREAELTKRANSSHDAFKAIQMLLTDYNPGITALKHVRMLADRQSAELSKPLP